MKTEQEEDRRPGPLRPIVPEFERWVKQHEEWEFPLMD
jgi:hypothetical protein